MNWKDALKAARKRAEELGLKGELDTKRQRRKFKLGFGRVRQLAGLPHRRSNETAG